MNDSKYSGVLVGADEATEAIPEELQQCNQWVLWKLEKRDDKFTKVPYSPKSSRRASTADPSTWSSYTDAINAMNNGHDYNGIGFVFSKNDKFSGVDIDHCVQNGVVEPWAQAIIKKLDSYTEISPSGKGVHILIEGMLPEGARNREGQVEIYSSGRYFAVTGKHMEGTPLSINSRQDELLCLHKELIEVERDNCSDKPKTNDKKILSKGFDGTDNELLERARKAANGKKFKCLFDEGDTSEYGEDDSAADQALCNILAFWCGNDSERIDKLFRMSALCRDKWVNRSDYRQSTINNAIAFSAQNRDKVVDKKINKEDAQLILKAASTFESKPIIWLWQNRFPRGMLSLLVGPCGVGKSFLGMKIAANISRGADWPDCSNPNGKGSVIIFSDEESPAYALRPRLDKCGADCNKVLIYDGVSLNNNNTYDFDIVSRLKLLDEAISHVPDCQIVLFDSITGFLGETDANSNADVRHVLTPLAELAERRNIAIIGISHFNKKIDLSGIDRVIGSTAFAAVSRSVWGVVFDGNSGDNNPARILQPLKTNYSVNPAPLRFNITDNGVIFSQESVEIVDPLKQPCRKAKATERAIEFLNNELTGKPFVPSEELNEKAEIAGISKSSLTKAKKRLNLRCWKPSFNSGWVWALPSPVTTGG